MARLLATETPPLPGRWQNFQQALSGLGSYAKGQMSQRQALEDAFMKALMEAQVKQMVSEQSPYQTMLKDYFDKFSKQYGGAKAGAGGTVEVGKGGEEPPFVFAPSLGKEGITLKPIKNPLFKNEKKKEPTWRQQATVNAIKSELKRRSGTTYSLMGEPQPFEMKTIDDALNYISQRGYSPDLFKEELSAFQTRQPINSPFNLSNNKVVVQDNKGNTYLLPSEQLKEAIKQGYKQVK